MFASFLGAQTPAEVRERALARAQAFVQNKQYEDALAVFQEMVRQNPQDLEARNWVGRLESWKGDYQLAEQTYRDILTEVPDNAEAELGLADVLSWQQRDSEAEQVLETLYARESSNPEVLLRLGSLARRQGQRSRALGYYRAVLALQPNHPEAFQAVETLLAQKPWQFAAGYFHEAFNFTSATNGQFLELLYRDWNRLFVLGRFQYQNKFRQNNTRLTAGVSYRFREQTWLRTEFGWAPPSHTVIAQQDYTVELSQGLPRSMSVGAGYRRLHFQDANVDALSVLFDWEPRPTLHLRLAYVPASTRFDLPPRRVWNHNGSARLTWDTQPAFSPFLSFAVGSESFSGLSVDQLGSFAAQTYGGGVEWRMTRTRGWRLGYYFQNRTQARHQQGFEVSYFLGL